MNTYHIQIEKIGCKWPTALVYGQKAIYYVEIDRQELLGADVGSEMNVTAEFVDLSPSYG